MSNTWGFVSLQHALFGYKELVATDPNLSDEQIFKKLSLGYYPFSGRENWPYKAWLNTIQRLKKIPRATLLNSTDKQIKNLICKRPKRKATEPSSQAQPMLTGMEG